MSDREQILDVIARYAHAVDNRDLDGIVDCFSPGGRIDFEGGRTSGEGHAGIRQAFEHAFTASTHTAPATSTHLMANTLITIDGIEAHAETQAVAYLASGLLGTVTTRDLRYSDDLRKEADGWRITHRTHRSIWQTESRGQLH